MSHTVPRMSAAETFFRIDQDALSNETSIYVPCLGPPFELSQACCMVITRSRDQTHFVQQPASAFVRGPASIGVVCSNSTPSRNWPFRGEMGAPRARLTRFDLASQTAARYSTFQTPVVISREFNSTPKTSAILGKSLPPTFM